LRVYALPCDNSCAAAHYRSRGASHEILDRHRVHRKPFTIDLVSIGLVAEDGREFYAESSEADWSKASPWTLENVRPQLDGHALSLEDISYGLSNFTDGDENPVFWGYFPAYDWVAFVGLFGGLEELPFHYPQLCLDIKQWAIELGDPELPHQLGKRHNSLADARWTKEA